MSLWTSCYADWDYDDLLKPIDPEKLKEDIVIDEEEIKASFEKMKEKYPWLFGRKLTHVGYCPSHCNVILD